MATIRDLSVMGRGVRLSLPQPPTTWRDELLPAHYDGCLFHVDTNSWEGGRRTVVHQFPKKDLPYSEDMGRRAWEFSVRGYIIVYPHNDQAAMNQNPNTLYQRDYRAARERLQTRLDQGGPGVLQMPTFPRRQVIVVCQQYRLTEEEKFGGYCTFDMQFVEFGTKPFEPIPNTAVTLSDQANALRAQIASSWSQQRAPTGLETVRMTFFQNRNR